ncbi:MAG: discoidin domain-containing protein, partial [Desulfomonile tiedjei]|nr:discoidin domain-containing protein [Desulfomonile tiedjei]
LTGVFDKVNEWVFTDWCHLTNGANYVLAKELVDLVKNRVFGLPLGGQDSLKNPADSYFRDYAKKAGVLLNDRPAERGLHILKGYPGPELLEVAADQKNTAAGVVLDLGETLPVSRLRIVWGDEKSVPKSWRVEFSQDGKDWQPWLNITETRTDGYDQWPGFEYYAHQAAHARYVRYVPTGEDGQKPIRLRQLSLFR